MAETWDSYLAEYHDTNPGITEDVLAGATDDAGRSPYDWLVDAVPASASTVIDLACGSGPVAGRLAEARVVGVDRSAGELGRGRGLRLQACATALPLAGGCADAVVSSMALMLLHPLDAVLAEVARVLAGGGTFVATLPVRSRATPAFAAVLRDLGQVGVAYPEPLNDNIVPRFVAAGLRLESDETRVFSRPVRHADDAATVVRGFYAPGAGAERVAAAVATLTEAAPVDLGYRIRRLVARR
jgi:ubiquinone/menaquinone biosynthesis C-methylase UbiE